MRARLLATDEALLAECTVKEYIWGIGLSILDANRRDLDCWKGQNLLGFSLMRVRERLRIDHAGSRYHRSNLAKKIVYDCLRH